MKLQRYNCRTVRNMLPLHVGGDLDPRHVPEVDRHLHDCLVCFREFRELGAMRGRLGVLAEQPLPAGILDGFAEEVMARIDVGEPGPAAEAPTPGPSQRIFSFRRLSAAAAVMLVALAGWRALSDQGLVGREGARLDVAGLSGSVSNSRSPRAVQPALRPTPVLPQQTTQGASGLSAGGAARGQLSAEDLSELLETAWPLGVPVESQVQIVLRSVSGAPRVILQEQAGKASGLERDEDREPRQRKP